MANSPNTRQVVVAQFAGSHGVRGAFKIRSYTENPLRLFSYGPLATKNNNILHPTLIREIKPSVFLCQDESIHSPEACAPFKGQLLHVDRRILPDTDDEDDFYVADLIGLEARDRDGRVIGKVKAVPNYGAGDIIEIQGPEGLILLPFTRECVPDIDFEGGHLTAAPPPEEDD